MLKVPQRPTNVDAKGETGGRATVSWNAPAADADNAPVTGYEIIASPSGAVRTTNADVTSLSFDGLTPGTTLHVHRACQQLPWLRPRVAAQPAGDAGRPARPAGRPAGRAGSIVAHYERDLDDPREHWRRTDRQLQGLRGRRPMPPGSRDYDPHDLHRPRARRAAPFRDHRAQRGRARVRSGRGECIDRPPGPAGRPFHDGAGGGFIHGRCDHGGVRDGADLGRDRVRDRRRLQAVHVATEAQRLGGRQAHDSSATPTLSMVVRPIPSSSAGSSMGRHPRSNAQRCLS